MSMHGQSDASFERINKSTGSGLKEPEEAESKSRKRCIIIVLLVWVLAAAITALILVLVFKGSSHSKAPKGYNGYTVESLPTDGKWYYEMLVRKTKNVTVPVPIDPVNNPEYPDLRYRVSMMNDKTFRIKINPVNLPTAQNGLNELEDQVRWEVPDNLLGNTKDDFGMRVQWGGLKGGKVNESASIELNFISTKDRNLVFSEYYIEMGFTLDSKRIYGFGERQGTFELNPGNYSSWANGRDNHFDNGVIGNNSYGDHPFVLAMLKDKTFAGIFFKNSNAKVLEITRHGEQSVLNFRAIGGVLDFFTFTGETAEDVIRLYHQVIGTPSFPPFWALGFQQSSWQYNSTSRIDEVLSGYDQSNMPLEAIWLDIEYMDGYKNFLVNTTRFPTLPNTAQALHQKGQKLIVIVDAGLAADDSYTYYKQADQQGLLIKSNKTGGNLIGSVWPGKAAFPDFYNPKTTAYWVNALKGLYIASSWDGIWLDMNEITTFWDGECPVTDHETVNADKKYPFSPTGDKYSIQNFSISLDGQHYFADPKDQQHNTEFNMHSLYGTMQAKATYEFWNAPTAMQTRRPFILSRSTFAGAGKWTAHWLGDNWSTWTYMQFSIAGIMDFNMFGIPLVGADVWGFHGNITDELWGRWMQLSAFYPFARNHYNLTWEGGAFLKPQEPYSLAEPYKTAAKLAIEQRYSFLRYFYTRLFEISRYGGGTFIRPLFFEFPDDDDTLQGYEHSFMVGKALKVSPVLRPDDSTNNKVKSYFPKNSRFVSLNDWTTVITTGSKGDNKTLTATWNYTLVHMNEGTIIPYQNTSSPNTYLRTKNLIENAGISLVIFPDESGHAEGTLYIDQNGDDVNDYALGYYQYYGIKYDNATIKFSTLDGTQAKGSTSAGNQVLTEIKILGMQNFTGDNLVAWAYDNNLVPKPVNVAFDSNKKMVVVQAKANDKLLFNSLQAIQFSNDNGTSTFCTPKYMVKSVTSVYSNEKSNDIVIKKVVQISAGNTPLLPDLQATFTLIKDTILRVEIIDPNDKNAFKAPTETFSQTTYTPTIDISAILTLPAEETEFFYEVHQFLNPKSVLYSTKGQPFIYSKHYKKTTAVVNSSGHIFGLGERVGNFFLDEGVYTLWARDEPSPIENGKRPGKNIYGVHPAYFTKLSTGTDFFAVFDHNAGAQDYILKKNTGNWTITQIKTSGVTDQYIILNAPITAVVSEFISLVGKPVMVPEWSLGWHQCRYGYNNTDQVNEVVQKYMAYNMPLDVMWTDIDYMDMYRDFTVSSTDFEGLAGNITSWKTQYGIRYVPILDAAVAYQTGTSDSSFGRGKTKEVFIKHADAKNIFVGKVWPGEAVYIDWLAKNAESYWVDELDKFNKALDFSGIWIDMNEASNFCDGYCKQSERVANSVRNKLFYTPGARDLNVKSISVDSVHGGGVTEYEAHSLYGFYMSKATSKYFSDKKKVRPFVITRSTYTGVGKFASHWLGDNFSTYDYLKYSIGGIFLFNMYGVPVVGADICGFISDTNPQLCARWYALGAFYPFARNHNDKASKPQEPYVAMFNQTIPGSKMTYTDFIREVSLKRYSMHRYHYSHTHKASTDGTIYFKPLFFNYPDDSKAYAFVERNVLLGDSVKLSPVVDDSTITSFYFPEKNAKWCPLWPRYLTKCLDGQSEQKQQVPYDEVLIHLKSGSIIPLQLRDLTNVPQNVNVDKLKGVTLDLAILWDAKYSASGFVRYDDGETQDLTKYSEFSFSALGASPFIGTSYIDITVATIVDNSLDKTSKNQKLGSVVVYNTAQFGFGAGAKIKIDKISGGSVEGDATYDSKNGIARFNLKDGTEVGLRDIKNIHVSSR